MSAPAGALLHQLQQLPARSRQGLSDLRRRLFQQGEKQPKAEGQFLRTSLNAHRPVWVTAGGGVYTSMVAVYLTMRYLRHVR